MIAIMSSVIVQRLLSMSGRHLALRPGQTLFCAGDAVRNLYVVIGGLVRLVRHQPNGAPVVLQRAHAGELLAEASLFASRYQCDAVAEQASERGGRPLVRAATSRQPVPA
jgi:CRP-like cAMP-binding protein